jgi:DNA polymerase-3 subunit gamma/tau
MQYQVLARKWRPQNFHELVGQEHISRTLVNALQTGRVAHAFLFSGPRGSGKTTTARVLAKALNCHAGKPGEPCGQCVACTEIAAGNCMDVVEMDAASNRGINEIRELIDNVRYSPARDKNKIFIVDEVHMLTPEAFNALLKTLEEPPPRVVFIMATTEFHKIPATILSRCQQYNFKLLPFPLILQRLDQIARAEKIQISPLSLEQIAFSSGGSMRDAMSAFDQVIAFSGDSVRDEDVPVLLGLVEPAILSQSIYAIARQDSEGILKVIDDLVVAGHDLQNFCRRLLAQFRNLMVLKAGATEPSVLGVPQSLVPELRKQAELFSREDLMRLFDSLLQTEADLKYATQIRFQLEMGLIKLAQISRLRALEDVIADFTALVKGDPPPGKSRDGKPSEGAPPSPASSKRSTEPPSPQPEPPRSQSRDLVQKIAAAVGRESLQSILGEVASAQEKGDAVIIDVGSVNAFYRQQIRENLPAIAQAASAVLGRPVKIDLGEEPRGEHAAAAVASQQPVVTRGDILEKARQEPIVQSFLDVFPGPVKAEKIE